MLTCRDVTERANEYVDGELDFWPAMQVRLHLLACRHCRGFVSQLRTVARLVWKYGYSLPEEDVGTGVLGPVRSRDLADAFVRRWGGAGNRMGPHRHRTEQMKMNQSRVAKGFLAGLAATVVLSILMLMQSAIGLLPNLDVIAILSGMMQSGPALAWLVHFMIGTVLWGGIFALVEDSLPGENLWLKGALFGIGAWLLMMVMVMPMAGAGLLGMSLGMVAPVMTLMLHLIFGAALGGTYGLLLSREHGHQHARS